MTSLLSTPTTVWTSQRACTIMGCSLILPRGWMAPWVSPNGLCSFMPSHQVLISICFLSGIPPNGDFTYVVPVNTSGQRGTYWTHAHNMVSAFNISYVSQKPNKGGRVNIWTDCGHRSSFTHKMKCIPMTKNLPLFSVTGTTRSMMVFGTTSSASPILAARNLSLVSWAYILAFSAR